MHQGSETTVAAALGRLRAEDERIAGDAEAAFGSLTWDQGLQVITQHGLQTFLWHAVLRAYERGGREGFRTFRGAQERSGVEPPDLSGPPLWFGWGPVMGEREAG